jgi:hypothetical protein
VTVQVAATAISLEAGSHNRHLGEAATKHAPDRVDLHVRESLAPERTRLQTCRACQGMSLLGLGNRATSAD